MSTHRKRMPQVVITGHHSREEWKERLLDGMRAARQVPWSQLAERLERGSGEAMCALQSADLVVICQERRGGLSQRHVDQLRHRFPLAGLVVVYGPWCEGETRSDRPLNGVARVSLGRWPTAWRQFCSEFSSTGTSRWHVPALVAVNGEPGGSTSNERCDVPNINPSVRGRMIGICGRDRALNQAVNRALQAAGFSTEPCPSPGQERLLSNCDAVVVNCWYGVGEAIGVASRLKAGTPVLALVGFPRCEDAGRLERCCPGSAILPKPFENQDLVETVDYLLECSVAAESGTSWRIPGRSA
jgi:hypothetical protein